MKLSHHRWSGIALGVLLTILANGSISVFAQMKTGTEMVGYDQTLGVTSGLRAYPYSVKVVGNSMPGNILFPGEQPKLTIQITNTQDHPINSKGHVDLIRYGTRGTPGDVWLPVMFKIADENQVAVDVDLAAGASVEKTIEPRVPETFGGYALVVDLGPDAGRQLVLSFVRTFSADVHRLQYSKFSLDHLPDPVLKRLGVQAIRYGAEWALPGSAQSDEKQSAMDKQMAALSANSITALLMVMGSPVPQPLDRPRPWLNEDGVMLQAKCDYAWLPQYDKAFSDWVYQTCVKYGWPKGPITAASLWNEPWEGVSISGWGADSLRYREIYKAMADGVMRARKDAGVQVLIGGCDSTTNAFDKLFSDGTDAMLDRFDFVSVHYQGLESPANIRKWHDRKGEYGRVKVWDTESWVANTDDRVATVVGIDRACGYDRAMGIYGGNICDDDGHNTWSVAASIGAMQHFIGERSFSKMLLGNALPWVMQFEGLPSGDGKPNPEDGTLVVVGDFGEEFGTNNSLYRTVKGLTEDKDLAAAKDKLAKLPGGADATERHALESAIATPIRRGTMTIEAGVHPRFGLFDFYGNPLSPDSSGKISVPLDNRGFFLRSDGTPGSFTELTAAVQAARIDGIEPVELVAHDLLASPDQHPPLHVKITNVLNRPISGDLSATIEGWTIESAKQLKLDPGQNKTVELKVSTGVSRADNSYALTYVFDAGDDGKVSRQESIHANVISHRTITVDGNLDDWKGVLPQPVRAAGVDAPTLAEAAWFPFKKFDASVHKGLAEGFAAYDDDNFYFAAKVASDSPDAGTVRFAKRDDDNFFYPPTSYAINNDKTMLARVVTGAAADSETSALQNPDGAGRLMNYWEHTEVNTRYAVDLSLPKPQRVALYFGPWENQSYFGVFVSVTDRKTGKILSEQHIDNLWHGVYAIYDLSDDIRISTRSGGDWFSQKLCGVFFDPSTMQTSADGHALASFVKNDLDTIGNWKGVFGKDGYQIVGLAEHLSAGVTLTVPNEVAKTSYPWPDGVRRFTYRRNPVLPAGNFPAFDNVQIGFNMLGDNDKITYPGFAGTPARFGGFQDTDYEYALNKVADQFGGGTEVWRLYAPGMPRKQFYPREPASPMDGAVTNAKLVIKQDGNTRLVECAIPWGELPDVHAALVAGRTIKFDYRVNDKDGTGMELATDRSVSKINSLTFHVDWVKHWSNDLEFAFEK